MLSFERFLFSALVLVVARMSYFLLGHYGSLGVMPRFVLSLFIAALAAVPFSVAIDR